MVLRDFLQEIGNNDIVGLAETHIHPKTLDYLATPGFTRINYKIGEPHSKGRCGTFGGGGGGGGGIAIFCKKNISDFFLPIENDNKDVIWVKIKNELLGVERDIYLATIYISPVGKKEDIAKTFKKLTEQIEFFQAKVNVILQGDLNARTKNKDEMIFMDKHDQESEQGNFEATHRNSVDTSKTDIRGEELLELCKALNFMILNGRKNGDPFLSMERESCSRLRYLISGII